MIQNFISWWYETTAFIKSSFLERLFSVMIMTRILSCTFLTAIHAYHCVVIALKFTARLFWDSMLFGRSETWLKNTAESALLRELGPIYIFSLAFESFRFKRAVMIGYCVKIIVLYPRFGGYILPLHLFRPYSAPMLVFVTKQTKHWQTTWRCCACLPQ